MLIFIDLYMIYILLAVIIVLLLYIAFFTVEKRERREVDRVRALFNTPIPAHVKKEIEAAHKEEVQLLEELLHSPKGTTMEKLKNSKKE